ncbi:MAG: hypothetical protein KF830_17370 [Planctomycetes bacterium]|nr:hypothetical protein [Planctomycetota bacterium]
MRILWQGTVGCGLLLAACHAVPARHAEQEFTLVYLRTGPTQGLDAEAQKEAFAGHFANMSRLAREGHLLLAGPFGRQRSSPDLRGVFVLATGDRAEAERLAGSDPCVRQGIFRLECHSLRTEARLREFLAAELAAEDAIRATGRTPAPGESGRGFALLTCDDGAAAEAVLRGHQSVVLFARLDGEGAWCVVDAADGAEARERLAPLAAQIGAHRYDDWFASRRLAERMDR